jgi:HD-GYP domain-containing protein (c-di-GMP phosphodiesterase class II)
MTNPWRIQMRRVNIDSIQVGVKLARTIFNSDGGVLLTKGVELKELYVEKLRNHGVSEVYLEDDISVGVRVKDVIHDQTRNEAVALAKNTMTNYNFSASFDVENVKIMVNNIIDELLGNDDILYNLSEIKSVDDYTFEHSVNVCILSLITGIGLGFDISRLRELGTGAMLHDIGKLCIPQEILKKPSQLTVDEFEEIKKHTIFGYEILKKSEKVSLVSAYIAFGHHERFDGSGYPLQLKNENIQLCARIAAVADVYDALTSDRVYRKKLRPNEVYEYITSLGANHFDPRVIESFVKYVTIYPTGTGVLLNTRERALVIQPNKNLPTRPVVRIVYDDNMKKQTIMREVDLSEQTNIFIVDGCEL